MSKGGRYLNKATKKPKRKGLKIFAVILSVLLVIVAGAAVAGVVFYNSTLNKITRAEVVEKDYTMSEELLQLMGTEPTMQEEDTLQQSAKETTGAPVVYEESNADILNVLLVGQQARDNEVARLADTMILVTVNKDTKVMTLTSFMRDTYVDLPDYLGHSCGWNRINTAYALGYVWGDTGGAMEMTNLCLKNNFGIEVDYNVEVDFTAFKGIVDIIGGVTLDLTEAEARYINSDQDNTQKVTTGETRLYGEAALSYARMRSADGDGGSDIKRTARQRTLLLAIFDEWRSKPISTIQDLINEVLPMISTNMTNAQITECMLELLPILPELTIQTGTCPMEGTYWGEMLDLSGVPSSVLKFEAEDNRKYMMELTEGVIIQ